MSTEGVVFTTPLSPSGPTNQPSSIASLSTVNATRLPHWRKAIAGVRDNSRSGKLLTIGDSTTQGHGSSGAATGTAYAHAYPTELSALFNSYHVPSVLGLVVPPITDTDNRWSGAWLTTTFGWAGQAVYSGNPGRGTLTFTPGILSDTYDVYYLTYAGGGNGVITATGGAPANVNTAGTNGVAKVTVTALAADTGNSVTVTTPDGFYVIGIEAYLSTTNVIRVGNAGVYGSTSVQWTNNPSDARYSAGCIKAYAPDLTILMLGINDALNSTAPNTYLHNLTTIIAAAQVSGDVVLASFVPSNPTGNYAIYEPIYALALPSFANQGNNPFVDIYNRFQSYAIANALGFMANSQHPNNLGYQDMAEAFYNLLIAV